MAIVNSENDSAIRDSLFRAVLKRMLSTVADNKKPMVTQEMEGQFQMISTPWFSQLLTYDPRPVLRMVKCPVLAMIGALKAAGNTDYTIVHLPALNHLFQTSKTGLPAEYGQIEETIAPRALDMIGDWIGKRVR